MKFHNQGNPNDPLKAERVQRADDSTDPAQPKTKSDSLKAERVQRNVKPSQRETARGPAEPDPPVVDLALHLKRLSGWSIGPQGDLQRTFTGADSLGARYFAEAIRESTSGLRNAPEIRRRDRVVQITLPGPLEGLTDTDFTIAAVIEDRWSEG